MIVEYVCDQCGKESDDGNEIRTVKLRVGTRAPVEVELCNTDRQVLYRLLDVGRKA